MAVRKLTVDHPSRVPKLMVLDICLMLAMYLQIDQLFATTYRHRFFFIQPALFPEQLMPSNPDVMINVFLRTSKADFHQEAWNAR